MFFGTLLMAFKQKKTTTNRYILIRIAIKCRNRLFAKALEIILWKSTQLFNASAKDYTTIYKQH